MPRSPNRRPVEIPTVLYAQLEERAMQEGRPVASVVADLLTDGLDAQEGYGRLSSEVVELRRAVEALRRALETHVLSEQAPSE